MKRPSAPAIATGLLFLASAACTGVANRKAAAGVSEAALDKNANSVDLTNPFHKPQGRNGRSCATCHDATTGWSVTPARIEALFASTEGTDPLFRPADANHPDADVSTVAARYASYSMLRRGLFRRGDTPPATREFDIVAATDPFGYGSVKPQRFSFFRRPLATANFHLTKNIIWDDNNTRNGQTVPVALAVQADTNIMNIQAGPKPTAATVNAIVAYESTRSFAQIFVPGVGRLDEERGRGGPKNLAQQAFVAGRFNLYDAWLPGAATGESPRRAAIARGQELFNTRARPGGGPCRACHDAENAGSNVEGKLFDTGVSAERWAHTEGLPIYTVRNRTTGEEIRTTDPSKANRTGKWADMNLFKVPTLRGLTARAPYFHNGLAKTLPDVVHFYEASLGFDFTADEENDLVAFLNAL